MMKPSKTYLIGLLTLALGLALGCEKQTGVPGDDPAASSAADDPQKPPFDREAQSAGNSTSPSLVPAVAKLPAGTPITIRLESAVSSASARAGDRFQGVLDEPIVIEGRTVARRGAAVTGRVLAAKSSGHLHDPGYLRIALVSVEVGGKPVGIETSSIFAKAGSHKNRNLAMIGGGTAGGALIGGLAGGGKGALIGTAVGAAGGTGTAYATGKKEITLDAERRFTFRLAQAADLS
jgi:hypothetical protein